jgi:TetR/AcrR family transcriptional repressor of mexJK operon
MSPRNAMASEQLPAKRRQILDGARAVFAEQGYERATVDQIAARAGVSKATVYNHFEDKQSLFVAAVVEVCADLGGSVAVGDDRAQDVEEALFALGEQIMTLSLSPGVVSLYRQVIAEVQRIPEIGRLVFERGTKAVQELVAAHLRRWDAAGALRIEDPRSAAVFFIALCQGDLVIRMRLGVLERPVDEQVRETVRRAVSIFVRAHRR